MAAAFADCTRARADGVLRAGFVAALAREVGEVQVSLGQTRPEAEGRPQSRFGSERLPRAISKALRSTCVGPRRVHAETLLHLGEP